MPGTAIKVINEQVKVTNFPDFRCCSKRNYCLFVYYVILRFYSESKYINLCLKDTWHKIKLEKVNY